MAPSDLPHFTPAQDSEEMQAIVLAAAIQGDEGCRGQLPRLVLGFEEPYRTIATVVIEMLLGGEFVDANTVQAVLAGRRLTRCAAGGRVEELTAARALDLIRATPIQPGQAVAYIPLLQDQLDTKRQAEFLGRAQETARQFGNDPNRLLREIETLVTEACRGTNEDHLTESLKFLPYFQGLMDRQTGMHFVGLDCGFRLLNEIANGLDTGLWVIAAPPSMGKTTFLWQLCQQTAQNNEVPVVFVTLEQSADELRIKALARLARLNTRHIARGRLRSDNPQDVQRLLQAARAYFQIGRHLTIVEGSDMTTIDTICAAVAAKKARSGAERCLVAIDYLQILPLSRDDSGRVTSSKDRIDLHVSALRRMARQLDSPVVAISSENRAGYKGKHLGVFKESGGIEYSSDIAAILTLDKDGTRTADGKYRMVDLNIVKNRNGETGVIKYKFYAERAEFIETERTALPEQEDE